jgi:glycosyltransferase involved in cell wall biosynthesis
VPGSFDPAQIAAHNYFVGMRLHGLIFSCQMGIPFLSLSYQPKNEAFCSDLGLKNLSVPLGGDHALANALDHLLAEGHHIRSDLLDRRNEYGAQVSTLMNGIDRLIRRSSTAGRVASIFPNRAGGSQRVPSPVRDMAPEISIILPVYNGEEFLAEAIQSCLDQSYQNWELLIIDDFSSDRSAEIALDFVALDPRIHYFRNDRNEKLPNSLNFGFSRATGEYLTWISHDNRFKTSALETLIGYLKSNPATDIVCSDYTVIDTEGRVVKHHHTRSPDEILKGNCVGPCFLMRRSVFRDENRFDTEKFLVEDYDFWLKSSIHHEISKVEEDLYLYRTHPGSLSEQHGAKIQRLHHRLVREYLPKLNWVPVGKKREAMEATLIWDLSNSSRKESARLLFEYAFTLRIRPRIRFVVKCVLRLVSPERSEAEMGRIQGSATQNDQV